MTEDNSNVPEPAPEALTFLTVPIRSRDLI